MAPRLLGSLVALAAFPIYLAMRGAPTALEVTAFAWLIAPILLSWFLSRTGRYEGAHILSALALAGLVMMVAITTGGIELFAAVWLIVVPLEAALSASRRVVAFASALALSCAALLIALGHFHFLPVSELNAALHGVLMGAGVASATLYAAGLAVSAESLARTSVALLYLEEDRYRLLARNMSDVISRHQPQRRRGIHFAGGGSHARHAGVHGSPAMACSTASMSSIVRPISRRCRMPRAAASNASNSVSAATRFAARTFPPISSGSRCVAGRSSRIRPRPMSSP